MADPLPVTMRALLLDAHGGPEAFRLADVPVPAPAPGEVLVRLAATSINPIDTKVRGGLPVCPPLPAILGCDVAGTVAAVGEGVAGFAVGDAVWGFAGGVKGVGGTYAEFIAADAALLAPSPARLTMREAAALPLVAVTAWDALDRAGITGGEHVLVHGGTGGVGHVAVQLAKARDARVATTVSGDDAAAIARDLGADEVINYRAEAPDAYVARLTGGRGFDLVFDTVGGDNLARSFAAVRAGGQVATTNARSTQDLSPLHAKGVSLHVVFVALPLLSGEGRAHHGRVMAAAGALAEAGRLRPLIDPARFTLATIPDAHRRLEAGAACGKLVIDIAGAG